MVVRNSVWNELVGSAERAMTPELARYVLEFDFSPAQQARAATLSSKAQGGTLTDEEQAELDEFLSADSLLTILQSKARIALRAQSFGG